MVRRVGTTLVMVSAAIALSVIGAAARSGAQTTGNAWLLPPDAEETKNPLTVDAKVLAAGKALYKDKCERCHGPAGLGDGPDAEPESVEDMDLTNPRRTARNSDGVVFYKVWNGRKKPKMPALKDELTKDQVWAIVAHAQTLRKPAAK